MTCRVGELPIVAGIGANGAARLVPGSYAADQPLPLVGNVLQTRDGPVPLGGQLMTAEGPVLITPAAPRPSGGYPSDVRYGGLVVTEYDPNGLGPSERRWR